MANAIANELQATTPNKIEITQYAEAGSDWQTKIAQVFADSANQTHLVIPDDVVTLAKIIKKAAQEKWQIIPCGSGSKLGWGKLSECGQLLVSTQNCDRVIDHAIDDLTITVEAGIKLADLQTKLYKTNQFLPIDPHFSEQATIGGIIATADTGSLRQRYGGIRDLVLGISFIRGDGEIAKAGGRVVKNVAGYDLMKLLIGSYGTLGIITQVTLRTYPIPKDSQTLVLSGNKDNIDQAIQLLKKSSLTPSSLDLINESIAKDLNLSPKMALIVRFQTITDSIAAQSTQLKMMLQNLEIETTTYQSAVEENFWKQIAKTFEINNHSATVICKLGILPSQATSLSQKPSILAEENYLLTHLGSGISTLKLNKTNIQQLQSLRAFCNNNNGFLSILKAPREIKQNIDVWGYGGNALAIMKTIKQKFDPHQILNSDRFVV